MKKMLLVPLALIVLSSCAQTPYILEGMARGMAETSYLMQMEQRRQWYRDARAFQFENTYRQAMYHSQHGHGRYRMKGTHHDRHRDYGKRQSGRHTPYSPQIRDKADILD